MLDSVLDAVADAGVLVLLAAAFGFAFAETALFLDVIVPGEVGLVVVGAAGERADVELVYLIGLATLGAVCGDSVSYLIGNRVGVRLVTRWAPVRRRLGPSVERAQAYFADRGGSAVFFGRFVGALRAVVPFVAGIGRMPYRRFLVWNVMASVAWTSVVVSLGYYVGREAGDDVDRVGFVFMVVIVGALVGYASVRWWRKSARG